MKQLEEEEENRWRSFFMKQNRICFHLDLNKKNTWLHKELVTSACLYHPDNKNGLLSMTQTKWKMCQNQKHFLLYFLTDTGLPSTLPIWISTIYSSVHM